MKQYWNSYCKQRNLCVKLFKSAKKDYYNNLSIKLVTDNKKFWETVSYGMESIRVRGPQLWQTLSTHIKNSTSLKDFKRKSGTGIPLIVNAVCADPIYLHWVFYNLHLLASACNLIQFTVIFNLVHSYAV